MWGDTSNTQCLPHAAYFRKFWSNSITSKSVINEERAVQWPLLAASPRSRLTISQGRASWHGSFVCVTRKILALLSKLFNAEVAKGIAKAEIAKHRESQVVQSTARGIPTWLHPASPRKWLLLCTQLVILRNYSNWKWSLDVKSQHLYLWTQ